MNRINIFDSFPGVECFFTQKPETTAKLIPQIAKEMKPGEYFIKPWLVHGNHIETISGDFLCKAHTEIQGYPELKGTPGYIEVPDTDGLATNIPGVALVTTHGDCLAVFVYDPVKKACGVAHAGWKGTMLGIAGELAQTLISEYGCKPENIHAYISPGIDKCCFEVREDVCAEFRNAQPWMNEFIRQKDSEHYLIDLKGINERFLQSKGVSCIEINKDCTCCLEDTYWSYRRCGDKNRMLAYIKMTQAHDPHDA